MIETSKLQKGNIIVRSEIELDGNVAHDVDHEAYRFHQMNLVTRIERERPDLLCRCEGSNIRVLTDVEAQQHTLSQTLSGTRKIQKQAHRRAAIDSSQMTTDEKRAVENADRCVSGLATVVANETKRLRLKELLRLP